MAINIIERAVTPYNSSANKTVNKEQYALYAPAANVNKPGMAGYNPTHFSVREQIVSLSTAFLSSLMFHAVIGNTPVDGIKETNTIYSGYTHEVIDRRTVQGTEEKITVTGDLIAFREGNCITEILLADGRIWTRKVLINTVPNGEVVQSISAFEPAFDKSVTYDQLAVDAVGTRNIKDANVTTIKIEAKAVTTEKIADTAVTTEKIVNTAVTTEKIANTAVTTEKIANTAVTTDKLKDEAVTAEKIRAGSVNDTKLSTDLLNRLNRLLALENDAFTDISYNAGNGMLTFTTTTGKVLTINLPLELIVSGGRYDEENQNLVLVLSTGDEIAIPIDDVTKDFIAQIDDIHESIFIRQKAPPLAALADAILLTTPTLAAIAGLT